MKDYIFVLGRDPELSIAEIKSYLKSRKYDFIIKEENKKIVLVAINNLNEKIIEELGGTVKIAEVFNIKGININQDEIKYGFSVYGYKNLKEIDRKLKDYFKSQKTKVIIKKPKKDNKFSPSEKGNFIDFVVYNNYIAKTILVSDPLQYIKRDSKPYFDRLKVTSIRLSKILINLAGIKEGESLLDPFCGTGTILQEALLLGINCYGIEKDHTTYEGCKLNLTWLKKNYKTSRFEVFYGDARESSKFVKEIDCVVTEPYLGPFLNVMPDEQKATRIKNELTRLYFDSLKELKKITKKKIVFISPVIPFKRGSTKPEMETILKKLNIKVDSVFNYQSRGNLIDREIYVLSP
jgi:tRNA G10  N-methylase Trm11